MADKRKTGAADKRIKTRDKVFPNASAEVFQTGGGGFAPVPRAVPMVATLINLIGGKENAGPLYQVLWAYDWGQGIIEVKSPRALLFQAGYTGTSGRADRTWHERVAILERLGFVRTAASGIEKYGYILLVDPYLAVLRLADAPPPDVVVPGEWMMAFESLAMEFNVDLAAIRQRADAPEEDDA